MPKIISKILTLLLLLTANYQYALAGGGISVTGSRSAAMGRTSVAYTDFWSAMNNQAGIALANKPMAGIFYESRFMLNELSSKSVAAIIPTKYGVFAGTYNHFGYKLYNDQKIGIAYARSFGAKFRIGVQLDYLQTTLGNNYGSKGNVTFEIGIQTQVTKNLTIGAWTYNPIMAQLAGYDSEKIPATYRLGIAWQMSEIFLLTLETEKNTAISPIIIRGGAEYELNKKFFFRTGFATKDEIFSFGAGIKLTHLVFNISATMHQILGFSPQSSLIFSF